MYHMFNTSVCYFIRSLIYGSTSRYAGYVLLVTSQVTSTYLTGEQRERFEFTLKIDQVTSGFFANCVQIRT